MQISDTSPRILVRSRQDRTERHRPAAGSSSEARSRGRPLLTSPAVAILLSVLLTVPVPIPVSLAISDAVLGPDFSDAKIIALFSTARSTSTVGPSCSGSLGPWRRGALARGGTPLRGAAPGGACGARSRCARQSALDLLGKRAQLADRTPRRLNRLVAGAVTDPAERLGNLLAYTRLAQPVKQVCCRSLPSSSPGWLLRLVSRAATLSRATAHLCKTDVARRLTQNVSV